MKKNLLQIFLLTSVFLVIILSTNIASAWNLPNNSVLTQGSDRLYKSTEIINTGCKIQMPNRPDNGLAPTLCYDIQGKKGPFITDKFLKSGSYYPWSDAGSVVAESYISTLNTDTVSGFYKALAPGKQGQLFFGGSTAMDPQSSSTTPVVGGNYNNGADIDSQLELKADTQFCNTQTMITTDTPAFQIWDMGTNKNAMVHARGVQLSGGNPQPGKILVSTDEQGNAIWATLTLSQDGTTVLFDY